MLAFGSAHIDLADPDIDRKELGADYVALLRAFLVDTAERCSFHRKRFAAVGFDPSSVKTLADLAGAPPLGPHELASLSELDLMPDHVARLMAGPGLASLPPGQRLAKKFSSSGSTGAPKIGFYTVDDWKATLATTLRLLRHVPESAYSRVFNAFHPGHIAAKLYEDALNRAGYHVENKHFTSSSAEVVVQQLSTSMAALGGFTGMVLPPRAPAGAASKGHTLAAALEVDLDNFIGRNIRLIVTSGAARDTAGENLAERVWEANDLAGAPRTALIDGYGTAEVAGAAAAECERNDGLHLLQGMTYTEVIDERTGQHVGNGEVGLVVCTGIKHGSRHIRYIVGDEARFISDPCACGRSSPRLRDIERVMDRQRLVDGCAAGW